MSPEPDGVEKTIAEMKANSSFDFYCYAAHLAANALHEMYGDTLCQQDIIRTCEWLMRLGENLSGSEGDGG